VAIGLVGQSQSNAPAQMPVVGNFVALDLYQQHDTALNIGSALSAKLSFIRVIHAVVYVGQNYASHEAGRGAQKG
jgi:hypothetical protein